MCIASSVGVDNCSGNRAKLAAIKSVVVSGAAGTCGSFHLMYVLLSAEESGTTNVSARSPNDMPRCTPSSTINHMHARPPSTPTSSRVVGPMPSIGTDTRIVSSGMAATIVPKKLCPNPWASTYAWVTCGGAVNTRATRTMWIQSRGRRLNLATPQPPKQTDHGRPAEHPPDADFHRPKNVRHALQQDERRAPNKTAKNEGEVCHSGAERVLGGSQWWGGTGQTTKAQGRQWRRRPGADIIS